MDEEGPGLRVLFKEPEKRLSDAAMLRLGGTRSLGGVGDDVARHRSLGRRRLGAADVAERLTDLRVDHLPGLPQHVFLSFTKLKNG